MSDPRPMLDDDGVPLCSETCPLFRRTKIQTGSVQYGCAHPDAGDPEDSICRPAIVAMVGRLGATPTPSASGTPPTTMTIYQQVFHGLSESCRRGTPSCIHLDTLDDGTVFATPAGIDGKLRF